MNQQLFLVQPMFLDCIIRKILVKKTRIVDSVKDTVEKQAKLAGWDKVESIGNQMLLRKNGRTNNLLKRMILYEFKRQK